MMLSLPIIAVVASLSKGMQVQLKTNEPHVTTGAFPGAKDNESFFRHYKRAMQEKRRKIALQGLVLSPQLSADTTPYSTYR